MSCANNGIVSINIIILIEITYLCESKKCIPNKSEIPVAIKYFKVRKKSTVVTH